MNQITLKSYMQDDKSTVSWINWLKKSDIKVKKIASRR